MAICGVLIAVVHPTWQRRVRHSTAYRCFITRLSGPRVGLQKFRGIPSEEFGPCCAHAAPAHHDDRHNSDDQKRQQRYLADEHAERPSSHTLPIFRSGEVGTTQPLAERRERAAVITMAPLSPVVGHGKGRHRCAKGTPRGRVVVSALAGGRACVWPGSEMAGGAMEDPAIPQRRRLRTADDVDRPRFNYGRAPVSRSNQRASSHQPGSR